MAKFELKIYDPKTEEVVKTYSRNMIPVNLYIKFQSLSEKLQADKITDDAEMFNELESLFLDAFPELTSEEYQGCADVAEVLIMFRDIIQKATQISSKN